MIDFYIFLGLSALWTLAIYATPPWPIWGDS